MVAVATFLDVATCARHKIEGNSQVKRPLIPYLDSRAMQDLPLADVLPISASVNDAGRLAIQDRDVREIVDEFGSPLYIFDEATIRGMCREFRRELSAALSLRRKSRIRSKAFSNPAILSIIGDEEDLHIDVVTGGEFAFALAANFPPEKINFHGNNKVRERTSRMRWKPISGESQSTRSTKSNC